MVYVLVRLYRFDKSLHQYHSVPFHSRSFFFWLIVWFYTCAMYQVCLDEKTINSLFIYFLQHLFNSCAFTHWGCSKLIWMSFHQPTFWFYFDIHIKLFPLKFHLAICSFGSNCWLAISDTATMVPYYTSTVPWFSMKIVFPGMEISIIKIRQSSWPWDHLTFIHGLPILVRCHLYWNSPLLAPKVQCLSGEMAHSSESAEHFQIVRNFLNLVIQTIYSKIPGNTFGGCFVADQERSHFPNQYCKRRHLNWQWQKISHAIGHHLATMS